VVKLSKVSRPDFEKPKLKILKNISGTVNGKRRWNLVNK
jgi:hypothetical protein